MDPPSAHLNAKTSPLGFREGSSHGDLFGEIPGDDDVSVERSGEVEGTGGKKGFHTDTRIPCRSIYQSTQRGIPSSFCAMGRNECMWKGGNGRILKFEKKDILFLGSHLNWKGFFSEILGGMNSHRSMLAALKERIMSSCHLPKIRLIHSLCPI